MGVRERRRKGELKEKGEHNFGRVLKIKGTGMDCHRPSWLQTVSSKPKSLTQHVNQQKMKENLFKAWGSVLDELKRCHHCPDEDERLRRTDTVEDEA